MDYKNYSEWKKWDNFFQINVFEKIHFNKEFKEIELKDKHLLDIGFGEGKLLAWAKAKGAYVHGVEIQKNSIKAAKKNNIPAWSNVKEIKNTEFDIICLFDVLEHLSINEIKLLFSEIHKIANEEAIILVRFPNAQCAASLVYQYGDATHISTLSKPILEQIIPEAQFKISQYKASAIMSKTILKLLFSYVQTIFQKIYSVTHRLAWGTGNVIQSPNITIIFKRNP